MEREKGRVRLGSRGDYDRVRAGCRTYSTLIFEVYTVAILDNHNVASEVLYKIKYFLEAVYERGRMLCAQKWIVRQLMPVLTMRSTRANVSCCVGRGQTEMRAGRSWSVRILL